MKIFVFSWLLIYVILFFLCVYNRIRLMKCALKLGEYIAEYEMHPVFPNDSETYRNAMTDLFRYNTVIKEYVKIQFCLITAVTKAITIQLYMS